MLGTSLPAALPKRQWALSVAEVGLVLALKCIVVVESVWCSAAVWGSNLFTFNMIFVQY